LGGLKNSGCKEKRKRGGGKTITKTESKIDGGKGKRTLIHKKQPIFKKATAEAKTTGVNSETDSFKKQGRKKKKIKGGNLDWGKVKHNRRRR